MSSRIAQDQKVRKMIKDLGLKLGADPILTLLTYCRRRVRAFLENHPYATLTDILGIVAGKMGTIFIEIHNDEELASIKHEYLSKGEISFARLEKELGSDVYGITFRRMSRERWEREFVSIIDCRGEKGPKSYFTKWHELAHLLTIPSQLELKFYRSDVGASPKDPVEALMDIIAGTLGFSGEIVAGHAEGGISFEKIQGLREKLCREASFTASLIGFVQGWPTPCLLVEASLGMKKRERDELAQGRFDFNQPPQPVLRALKITSSEAARRRGLRIHQNMRVPESSVIYRVFYTNADYLEDLEDLSSWESSDGSTLPDYRVIVKAKKFWGKVYALIVPSEYVH